MAMNGYVDVDVMMCDGLFDNIEDFLDFSGDDEVLGMESADNGSGNGDSQMPPAVGAEKISELKSECRVMTTSPLEENGIDENINIGEDWVSNFLDNCNFDIDFPSAAAIAIPTPGNGYINKEEFLFQETTTVIDKDESLFRSSSPISVLEPNNLSDTDKGSISSSSSSSSSCISSTNEITNSASLAPVGPTMSVVPARARSKRPRRAAHITAPILPPSAGGPPAVPTLLPDCESFGESCPPAHPKKKKKRTKMLAAGDSGSESGGSTVGRKCLHCGIQKTPQWRAGPMGPKTLCNACGVRYKSGRLFPEYRPAASPTFVPSIHSNSHKKVVEMRIKANGNKHAPLPQCPAAKNCDLLAYIH